MFLNAEIDPDWAWAPFEPTDQQPWDRRAAAHLFRRATFGAATSLLDSATAKSPSAAVDQLFAASQDASLFDNEMRTLERLAKASGEPQPLVACWLYRILHSPASLREKLTLFWHGHFATSNAKVASPRLMLEQVAMLRRRALGPFVELVQGVSRDPAMLIYLDSRTNRKLHPNENFAREVMELFCLGLGNFGERDVQQIARCFTGWEVRNDHFRFNPSQHDSGEKRFLGHRGPYDGDEAVRIIVDQPATAQFIAAKLYRYYVADEPAPSSEFIRPLARHLADHGFRIEAGLRRILTSNVFYSRLAVGRKVRSPIELTMGLLHALEATCSLQELADDLRPLGHTPFYPPNVKGWDGGRKWINSTTLLGRANLVHRILNDESSRFDGDSLEEFAVRRCPAEPRECVAWLAEMLLAAAPPEAAQELLTDLAERRQAERTRQVAEVVHVMSTLPEFHLA